MQSSEDPEPDFSGPVGAIAAVWLQVGEGLKVIKCHKSSI